MKKPSEILQEMIWVQHEMFLYGNENKILGCCMIGAISIAHNSRVFHVGGNIGAYALSVKTHKLEKDVGNIVNWNDMPGRTKEECIAKFKEFDL